MQIYETVVVVHPRLSDSEVSKFSDKTKKTITEGGGELLSEDTWGRRKLAYPIEKAREGFYIYYKFQAPGTLVQKLNKNFRIDESILRTLTVLLQKPRKVKVKTPKAPKAPASAPTRTTPAAA
jgi:small subunit ribosomal protein S6